MKKRYVNHRDLSLDGVTISIKYSNGNPTEAHVEDKDGKVIVFELRGCHPCIWELVRDDDLRPMFDY